MSFDFQIDAGNVSPGGYDYLYKPRTIRGADKYGVVLLHGASGTSDWDFVGRGWASMNKLACLLASEGIPCIGGYMDGNHFSKAAVTDPAGYIDDAIDYMAAQTGCSSSKAHLFGVSMGAGAALKYAALNTGRAASASGLVPGVSIEHAYTDNPNNVITNGFPQLIANGLSLAYRAVADGVTTSNTTLTSATANFQDPGDVGKQITRAYNATGGIPVNTKIASVTNSTTVVMDKAAASSATGLSIGIGAPLDMTGTDGFDLIGVHAPILAANGIPNRWYYASDDPYVYVQDVLDAAAAAGGAAINLGVGGHDNDSGNNMAAHNGDDFEDFMAWLIENGA